MLSEQYKRYTTCNKHVYKGIYLNRTVNIHVNQAEENI